MDDIKTIGDVNYFKYIFKKTEKISCAVFYILRSEQDVYKTDSVIQDVEDSARRVLNIALESLQSTEATRPIKVANLRFALIALESKLRIAQASRYIGSELMGVFIHEIDSVYRSMKRYTDTNMPNPFSGDEVPVESPRERKVHKVREVREVSEGHTQSIETSVPDISRKDRIIQVLRDNPDATIKDIAGVITDCSEKTIQRELIAMIKDNIVVREGERRWSKYKLV